MLRGLILSGLVTTEGHVEKRPVEMKEGGIKENGLRYHSPQDESIIPATFIIPTSCLVRPVWSAPGSRPCQCHCLPGPLLMHESPYVTAN